MEEISWSAAVQSQCVAPAAAGARPSTGDSSSSSSSSSSSRSSSTTTTRRPVQGRPRPLPAAGTCSHSAVWDPNYVLPMRELVAVHSSSEVPLLQTARTGGTSGSDSDGPAREVSRAARVRRLQQLFAEQCKAAEQACKEDAEKRGATSVVHTIPHASLFEQWHFTWLFESTIARQRQRQAAVGACCGEGGTRRRMEKEEAHDPLLPRIVIQHPLGRHVHDAMELQLRSALGQWLPQTAVVSAVVKRMLDAAIVEGDAAAVEMTMAMGRDGSSDSGDSSAVTIGMTEGGQQVEVRWRDTSLRLSPAHYGKLRHMWQLRRRRGKLQRRQEIVDPENDIDNDDADDGGNERGGVFGCDLFCLLLRYRTIRCSQFHAALPGPVFDWLRGGGPGHSSTSDSSTSDSSHSGDGGCRYGRGVQLEGMASPLNARWSTFCSAFPDTDGPFGSLGSFFGFHPTEGSYEVNPPFVETMYAAVVKHCTALLVDADKVGKALSFTIVVGATEATQRGTAWEALRSSCFLQSWMIVGAKEHRYCDGAQHTRTKPTALTIETTLGDGGGCTSAVPLVSVCSTGVFCWASEAGRERWPVDNDQMEALHSAFIATGSTSGRISKSATWAETGAARSSSARQQVRNAATASGGGGVGGYSNKRKVDRLRQRKDRQRQKAKRKKKRTLARAANVLPDRPTD